MKQKFFRGDVVTFKGPMPPSMRHFPTFTKAIILGSYNDLCVGNSSSEDYALHILESTEKTAGGYAAWYPRNLLKKIGVWSQKRTSALKD